MRSQKINNRAPRPFKNKNSDRWSGVRDQKPFFSAPKPILRAAITKSQTPASVEKTPDSQDEGK